MKMPNATLTPVELATVLAGLQALRAAYTYADDGATRQCLAREWREYYTVLIPPTRAEIDKLCERINAAYETGMKTLRVSTAHILRDDGKLLTDWATTGCVEQNGQYFMGADMYGGWFYTAGANEDGPMSPWSPALHKVLATAAEHGWHYVRFDADGDVFEDLQAYHWKSDTPVTGPKRDNVDPETGIPFGTIYTNTHQCVEQLFEEIQERGINTSAAQQQKQLRERLSAKAVEFYRENTVDLLSLSEYEDEKLDLLNQLGDSLVEVFQRVVRDIYRRPEQLLGRRNTYEILQAMIDTAATTVGKPDVEVTAFFDAGALVSDMENHGLWDQTVDDEPTYRYTEHTDHGEVIYEVFWLGGASAIDVIRSPWVTWCRLCSPCVPNAGDLSQLEEYSHGMLAYCLPPDYLRPEDRYRALLLS